jgi:putative phage-type endonuclease
MNIAFERTPYKDKETWLSIRGKGLGGSDVASIIGQNPYKTNLDLWKEKVSKNIMGGVEDNFFTIYGRSVENSLFEIAKADFVNIFNITHSNEVLIRLDKPYLRASLDGEIEVLQDYEFMSYWKPFYNKAEDYPPTKLLLKKGMRGILEIKSTFVLNSMSKEKWRNSIPMNYYCQTLHYLNVTNYDFIILPAMLNWEDGNGVKTHEIRYYGYLRDEAKEDLVYLEKKCDDFWLVNVEKNIEPPLIINI